MRKGSVDHTGTGVGDLDEVVLSVIIATYNGRDLLADCLDSIYANPPSASFEIIVVDDASSDGTSAMVRERFPEVRLLRNKENAHYGKSNNLAIELARGRIIYLLNNDTVILSRALDEMISFLEEHPEVGAVGSKLLNEDGTVQWSVKTLPNPMSAMFGARSVITKLFPRNPVSRKHLLHLSRDMNRPFTAGYVSSASMMMPRAVFDDVGPLDERLSYHIDADYCKRIADTGREIYYLPSATVVHLNHKGGTMVSRRRRFRSVLEFHRGSYIYFQKHMRRSFWDPMQLFVIVGLVGRFVASLALQMVSEIVAECRGLKRVLPSTRERGIRKMELD